MRVKIRQVAESQGFTLDALARVSGVKFNTLKNLWYGQTKDPNSSTLIPIAQALGVDWSELVEIVPEGVEEAPEAGSMAATAPVR